MIKYFVYRQNNSNGEFHINENVTEYVILSAQNACQADVLLQSLGGYFEGVSLRVDCLCCGDRWTRAIEDSALRFPCARFERAFYSVSEFAVYLAKHAVGQRALQYGFMTMV